MLKTKIKISHNYKKRALLFSLATLLFIGCSQKREIISLEKSTVSQAQYSYEKIKKPIKYKLPSVTEQKKDFEKYTNYCMTDIDNFKKGLYTNQNRRYGKNIIHKKPTTQTISLQSSDSKSIEKRLMGL